MISSAIIKIVATVRCPSREPGPRPTKNATPITSSSHSPILTISLTAGFSCASSSAV